MSAHSLTDTNDDRGMVKVMGMVLFSLFLLSLFLFSTARLLGVGAGEDESDRLMRNALISRIEPVGQVRTSADDLPQAGGTEVAAAGGGAERSGEELVGGVCAGCHQSGAAGAPMLGDEEAWAERREAGLDNLVASVINGKGSMPARGGSDYSDEEIRRAVQHIALFEEEAAPAEAAPEEEAAAAGEGEGETGDAASAEAAADDDAEMASGDEADGEAGATGGEAADAGGESVDLVALIGSGEVPDGMSDGVKGAVDGVCAGCHVAGAAGAPKLGDKEAWTPRAESGLAALTESVTNGKGAMPARGGSQLTDEEIPVAIKYLMAKQP